MGREILEVKTYNPDCGTIIKMPVVWSKGGTLKNKKPINNGLKPNTTRQYKIAMERAWKEIVKKEEELLRIDEEFMEFTLRNTFTGKTVQFTNDFPNFSILLDEKSRAFLRRNISLTSKLLTLEFNGYQIQFYCKTKNNQHTLFFSFYKVEGIRTRPLTLAESESLLSRLGAASVEISG